MSESPQRTLARSQIVKAARALLDGQLDALKAAVEIARFRLQLDPDQEDTDLLAFAGIESQVDELLVADSLRGWPSNLEQEKKAEYDQAERFFRQSAVDSARSIVERYGLNGRGDR